MRVRASEEKFYQKIADMYATAIDYDKEVCGAYAMPGILVVEDDENLNRGITFSLKKSGYEVFQQNQ